MTLDNFPTTRPAFTANFARSQQLPPQVTFSRASSATAPAVPSPGTATGPNGPQLSDYDTPRFAWKDGKCQGLLIEESRTNYLQHNSDFSNAAWYKRGTPATAAPVTTAPDGTLTAQGAAISPAANTYVLSVYTPQTNIAGGLVSTDLTNEWQYYSQQFTYVNSTDRFTVYPVQLGPNNYIGQELLGIVPTGKVTVSGWAKTDGSNIWVWGVQAEAGGFATSLIPTSGATATRAPDLCQINNEELSSWYNSGGGTYVTEFNSLGQAGTIQVYLNFIKGSGGGRLEFNIDGTVYGWYQIPIRWGSGSPSLLNNVSNKTAMAHSWLTGEGGYSSNGITPIVTAAIDPAPGPYNPTGMAFGYALYQDRGYGVSGYIQRFSYYPTRVPDESLEALTQ